MKTLNNTDFTTYLEGLEFIEYSDCQTLQDEVGEIITLSDGDVEFNETAMLNREEYQLTEPQKEQIAELLEEHVEMNSGEGISNSYEENGVSISMFI